MAKLLKCLGLVFAAELGDKTQLVAMAFAAKYTAWKVVVGVTVAISFLNLFAVILGTYITTVIPISVIQIVAAVIFLLFGVINLIDNDGEEKEKSFKFGAIATVAITFFISELGDKTQLMTITLAANYNSPVSVFFGSTLGMILADSLGIIVGATVFKKIPAKAVKIISSAIFLLFGSIGLYNSLPDKFITALSISLYIIVMSVLLILVNKYNESKKYKQKTMINIKDSRISKDKRVAMRK